MKKPPLLKILLIYHEGDHKHVLLHDGALRKAFEYLQPDRSTTDLDEVPDVWERVSFKAITNGAEWNAEAEEDAAAMPTLFIVIVTDKLTNDAAMKEALETIASLMPARPQDGNCDLLAYTLSETALSELPPVFRTRQVKANAALGESRIAPHKLGLIALHRTRLLLGETREADKLKIFVSHAKLDGVIFAQALAQSIGGIPELEAWYDAEDLQSGSDFLKEIESAAAGCVLIALRTNAYDQRSTCRKEFMTALFHGVPIVVVDALMQPVTDASALPFCAVPNVRIPDGNTYRVLLVTLREHLKLLLMRASVLERAGAASNFRVWPRLPSPATAKQAWMLSQPASQFWLVPRALCYDAEFLELRDWLLATKSGIEIDHLETYRPSPVLP
jgi:hypothetical protein